MVIQHILSTWMGFESLDQVVERKGVMVIPSSFHIKFLHFSWAIIFTDLAVGAELWGGSGRAFMVIVFNRSKVSVQTALFSVNIEEAKLVVVQVVGGLVDN